MVKVPLQQPIILLTNMGDLYCTVKFAGRDTLKLINVKKRLYTESGDYVYSDELDEELIVDRSQVLGYSRIAKTIPKQQLIKKNNKVINFPKRSE